MKSSNSTRKLALAGLLTAIAVVGGMFSIPIGAAKCSPVQHMVNVLAAVLLGPWYAVGSAFVTSLIRNLIGTGSLLAFPGSMVGALLAGLLYQRIQRLPAAFVGEVCGTGILGAMLSYPIAVLSARPRRSSLSCPPSCSTRSPVPSSPCSSSAHWSAPAYSKRCASACDKSKRSVFP
ncbi:MAG: energy coupling factor transporter S component ThiW [Butyricicoccus pullicaecorum]